MRLRRTRRGWEVPAPAACGHPLTAHQVLVGVVHCGGGCGANLHLTWTCRRCGDTVYSPPLGLSCMLTELDGRARPPDPPQ